MKFPGDFWGSPGGFRGSLGNFRGTSGLLLSSIVRELPVKSRRNFQGTSREVRGLSRSFGKPDSLPATRQICLQKDTSLIDRTSWLKTAEDTRCDKLTSTWTRLDTKDSWVRQHCRSSQNYYWAVLLFLRIDFPTNYRYRYRLENWMNSFDDHYRYRLGVRSDSLISIDSQLPS